MTFYGKQPSLEDNLRSKTTFDGDAWCTNTDTDIDTGTDTDTNTYTDTDTDTDTNTDNDTNTDTDNDTDTDTNTDMHIGFQKICFKHRQNGIGITTQK